MRRFLIAGLVLISAAAWCGLPAWPSLAQTASAAAPGDGESRSGESARLARLTQGQMAKFRFSTERPTLPDVALPAVEGPPRPLSSWRGKTLLLHFWASWCAPCQTEIPEIARLEARLGDPQFAVYTVSLDKAPEEARRFLASLGVPSLPLGSDPEGNSVAGELDAKRLPTSILIDPEGREIGRIEGSAKWLSDDALLLLMTVLSDARGPALPPDSAGR